MENARGIFDLTCEFTTPVVWKTLDLLFTTTIHAGAWRN